MRSAGSLLVAVAVAGCAQSTTPSLIAITPAVGPDNYDMPVTITGTDFRLPLVADLDHGGIEVGALSATIGGIQLVNVTQRNETTIDAVVPAGLPLGPHDVVVTFGAHAATLPDGYTVAGTTLTSMLSVSPWLGVGDTFSVTMTVTNTGAEAVDAVMPSMVMTSGTATVTLVASPAMAMSLSANSTAELVFTYTASASGTITFSGNVTGMAVASASTIASAVTSATANVVEAAPVLADPFGDGSTFGYVVGYHDEVYVGPSQTGNAAVRMHPDGTAVEPLTFTFTKDTSGANTSSNMNTTYKSIGFTGCTANSTCGPDNEDGRGFFATGTFGGSEWLVIGGARSNGDLDYVYMTTDTDTALDFRYVDLSPVMGGATRGFSAAYAFDGRFYFGFPDSGGARPYFVALLASPPLPGLDTATPTTAINMGADNFPGWQTPNPAIIDSMIGFNGLLYVASAGGIMMATTPAPRPYGAVTSDWANITPSSVLFGGKTSRAPQKMADLMPSDRAFPQLAVYKGRVYAGRNTTAGPQLWMCDPTKGSFADRCEPGDWALIAVNDTTGDPTLSQFNDTSLTSITMVVATPQQLYVGYDSANGVQVFRTTAAQPNLAADFRGQDNCVANLHPTSCQGLGGAGLGSAANTKILDAKSLTFSTGTSVWATVGNDAQALQLVVIP